MLFAKTLLLLHIMSTVHGETGDSAVQVEVIVEKGIVTSDLDNAELVAAKRVLALLKGKIGGEEIQSLLADDIAQANKYWHQLLSTSANTWTPVEAQAKAIVDPTILNSRSFQQWMNSAGIGYPNDLIAGHPEIYFEEEPSNVIQSWGGGPITQFSHDPVPHQPFFLELTGWKVTAEVSQTLRDNTSFSYAVSAIKDEADGFGLYFAVYLPSSAPKDRIEGLRSYLTVECTNWLKYAYRHAIAQN
ncbi:hypothetical protein DE146DRAFT_645983 [Phaeosphaeria sp. MPI-PUGE-AT-0046c]|nr:hypothetical protein DE146DRAFT_645983 [Phaeosphaeria sp. MPI-PUGE-AT-0046c]